MNKEQAKLKLETSIINYENQIKFLDPASMYTRGLIDAKGYSKLALKELEDTGKHSYEDTTWKDSYAKVFTDEEILEFLLSKPRVTFKGNQEKLDEIKKEREKIQKEATKDLPKGSPLGDLSKENYEKFWGALQWSREEREKLTQESRAYYENYLKKIKENK